MFFTLFDMSLCLATLFVSSDKVVDVRGGGKGNRVIKLLVASATSRFSSTEATLRVQAEFIRGFENFLVSLNMRI